MRKPVIDPTNWRSESARPVTVAARAEKGDARNAIWIAVAESGNVGCATLACEAARRKLVESGQPVVAFEDESCHRTLSSGRPNGRNMICAYHALTFGFDGPMRKEAARRTSRGSESRSYDAVDWAELADAPDQTEHGSLSVGSRHTF